MGKRRDRGRAVWFPTADDGCPAGGQHQAGSGMGDDPGKCGKCGQQI